MKVWDVRCKACGSIERNCLFASWESLVTPCPLCKGEREKLVGIGQKSGMWHARDRVVVYRKGDDIKYPGRNDTPMPERYRRQGYERVEMSSLAEVNGFERKTGLMNEAMHYDRNGKTDRADTPATPQIRYSDLLNG